jgi:aromatic-L-amino-acid/L-tryptophan decarboxylase
MTEVEKETRRSPVAMSGEEFRKAGHQLVDRIGDFLDSLPQKPVTRGESPSMIREVLDAERKLPESGTDAGALLDARRI